MTSTVRCLWRFIAIYLPSCWELDEKIHAAVRICPHLVSSSVLSDPITGGQIPWGCVWDQITFSGGQSYIWPHAAHMCWATLMHCLLKWRPPRNMKRKKEKPQQQAEWITHCLISMWFTVMQTSCPGSSILQMLGADTCEHAVSTNTLTSNRNIPQTPLQIMWI